MLRALFLIAYILCTTSAYADTVQSGYTPFTGPNVYSPSVIYDYQEATYKMWYGGWQLSTQREDHIYYRTSNDGLNWPSSYTEVLTPEFVTQRYAATTGQSVSIKHVNDPSVTKHFNATSQTYQYTMFFSACMNYPDSRPCEQIWSVVSNDGVNWDFPTPLNIPLPTGIVAPQNPSAFVDASNPSNVVWQVYFSTSKDPNPATNGNPNQVFLVYVNGYRATYTSVVSVLNPGITVQNPSVMVLGSTWYVFWNSLNSKGGYDIYYSISPTNRWNGYTPIVVNNGNTYCSSATPGATPLNSSTYNLYFSLIQYDPTSSVPCDPTQNRIMEVFRITH